MSDPSVQPRRRRGAQPGNSNRFKHGLYSHTAKARRLATPFMTELRHAVGLRNLRASAGTGQAAKASAKQALPSFKQYRESDGRFHFKLVDAQGRLLVQSAGFTSPKDAGAAIARLQKEGEGAWDALAAQLAMADGVQREEVAQALRQLVEAAAG